jgi:hypothetical protein
LCKIIQKTLKNNTKDFKFKEFKNAQAGLEKTKYISKLATAVNMP